MKFKTRTLGAAAAKEKKRKDLIHEQKGQTKQTEQIVARPQIK